MQKVQEGRGFLHQIDAKTPVPNALPNASYILFNTLIYLLASLRIWSPNSG